MNSRDRVLSSINHKEPDRVAIDLGSTPSSGISAIAYSNLKKHLGMSGGHNRVYDVVQQVAQPEYEILDKFGVDVLDIGRMFNDKDSDWYDFILPDGSTAQYPVWFRPVLQKDGSYLAYNKEGDLVGKMPVGATFFDQTGFPYLEDYPDDYSNLSDAMGKVLWQALAHSPWDHASESDFWIKLREKALYLRQNSDRALMVVCGCNLFEWGTFLRRMDNFMMDVYSEPEQVEALLDALMQKHLESLRKVCEAVGDVVDILRFGDDLGMDSGPFMSPEIYRTLFKPRHSILCDYVHKNSSMKTFLHSCGSIYRLTPDLIEAGYDILNPIQTTCFEMEPERLKKEFGADITFWGGGSDTRFVLNRGTVDDVKNDVKRRLEVFAPGGGYVFNPIHNIMPDVPPENIVAMFDAVDEFYR
jgi:uroporphyrinogen decarboxylase